MLTRQIKIQMAVFVAVAVAVVAVVFIGYLHIQSWVFGVGRYTVTVQLPQAGNLYRGGNVTYRGVSVGRVRDVRLTVTGTEAVLQLDSNFRIPATDLTAEVHSMSAVGEQFVALAPHSSDGPVLKDGDVIPVERAYVPPDINTLVAAANRGLQAIPHDNLKTVIDESYAAVGGLGPELSRLIRGTTTLAIDARKNLDALTALIDEAPPLLESQIQSADSVQAWAANLAAVTKQLRNEDASVESLIRQGSPAAEEARQLLDRVQPTLPIIAANLASVGDVAVVYRDNLEQLLVILPAATAGGQATLLPQRYTKQAYRGLNMSFNLNMNLPPACLTGFLPAQQMRSPTFEDHPGRPAGELYCRVPQDSALNVRGARNYPCETRPGKRAATVKLCESDEPYIPLNDGYNWKGDPNATLSGQDVPQLSPAAARPVPPPIAITEYDPATGAYVGPDGLMYRQADLAGPADQERTWQQMMMPPPEK